MRHDSYRDADAEIKSFVKWGVLFFLGSACVSPKRSTDMCRNTAKKAVGLRSFEKVLLGCQSSII